MIVYFCVEVLCSWNKHCKIILLHGMRVILKRVFKKWVEGAWTGSIWLRIGTSGGHL